MHPNDGLDLQSACALTYRKSIDLVVSVELNTVINMTPIILSQTFLDKQLVQCSPPSLAYNKCRSVNRDNVDGLYNCVELGV